MDGKVTLYGRKPNRNANVEQERSEKEEQQDDPKQEEALARQTTDAQ